MNNPALHHHKLSAFHAELVDNLLGSCDFSSAGVAMYSSDASNYRQVPLGVVFPKNAEDIKTAARLCHKHSYAMLMRGGGTSQNGQCVNEAVVVDCSQHMSQVLEIDTETRTALIEPGTVCDALKHEAEKHGLTFGPDPATHSRCTLGGMIGNNSCGPHSMLAGKTVENVVELEVLTSDGASFWVGPTSEQELAKIIESGGRRAEIYQQLIALRDEYADDIRDKYPNIKRRVSGYNLDQLLPENGFNVARALVGSEGTCISILQARVRLIENPKFVQLVVLGFNDIFMAGDAVPSIMPFKPIAMEGLDWNIVGGLNDRNLRQKEVALLPNGHAWLLVELSANTKDELKAASIAFCNAMQNNSLVNSVLEVTNAEDVTALWSIREQGASATSLALNPGDTDPVVGWEDTAVDPLQLGDYLRELYALVEQYEYKTSLYGHFGDGCIHARMTFDTRTAEGVAKWRRFSQDIATLVVKYGGSLSGEHGDGQAKAEFLPIMFGERLITAFEQFKSIWDPAGSMNPRKVVNPYRMDENLRYGPDYKTPIVNTTLQFVDDPAGLGRASERCIGMGKCRSASGAMCPSYQATSEERYSTRGRARLLHEMMRGEIIADTWQNTAIADSLEHCLSCKACKSSCPTKVDIASYKAEFMHHHYANGRRRPLNHYAFGFIGHWLPYAARFAPLVNLMSKPPFDKLVRTSLGLVNDKPLPPVAPQPFANWAKTNASYSDDTFYWHGDNSHPSIVLWADTLNSHYAPQLLQSAVAVLKRCNFQVAIAKAHFCCGRPLYEYGFLDQAKKQSTALLDDFYPRLPVNADIIVLEPSCLSVFKDELLKLHPTDKRAAKLAELTQSLAQFLMHQSIKPSHKLDKGLLHFHCHDKSLSTHTAERDWLLSCFNEVVEPESGCCGMAGTFGMQQKTRAIADRLMQRNLAPALADADSDTFVVSSGFSCRTQFSNSSHKRVYHPVEIIEKCM